MKRDESFGVVPYCCDARGCRILMVQHKSDGHWSFPKGHMQEGETIRSAAFREFYEETGVCDYYEMSGKTYQERYEYARDGKAYTKDVSYILARIDCDQVITIPPGEIRQYRWFSELATQHIELYPSRREIVEKVFNDIREIDGIG